MKQLFSERKVKGTYALLITAEMRILTTRKKENRLKNTHQSCVITYRSRKPSITKLLRKKILSNYLPATLTDTEDIALRQS